MVCRNLAAKNHESQTALHLASYHGHVEVVEQLVTYGAKVSNILYVQIMEHMCPLYTKPQQYQG